MIIPKQGRVVIVDNEIDDVKSLMAALSKEGISFTYFNGGVDTLPETPLNGVKVVFFDLELEGSAGNDRTKASQDVEVLKKIL